MYLLFHFLLFHILIEFSVSINYRRVSYFNDLCNVIFIKLTEERSKKAALLDVLLYSKLTKSITTSWNGYLA